MKIVFLDAKTIGEDIDLSGFDELGEVVKYGFSTAEEARERSKDADVLVLNKVQVNEQTIGAPASASSPLCGGRRTTMSSASGTSGPASPRRSCPM